MLSVNKVILEVRIITKVVALSDRQSKFKLFVSLRKMI